MGQVVSLYTKGWLPYSLRWQFRVTDVRPDGSTLEAISVFVRRGIWTIKPVFTANHNWAIAWGRERLEIELARGRAISPEEAARLPKPPGPTFAWLLPRGKSTPAST